MGDQADPAKVRKIIALVQVLTEAANAKAIGIWRACQKAVEDAENAVATAKGERDAHIEYANKRIAVVNGEIEQFEEIIVLLQPCSNNCSEFHFFLLLVILQLICTRSQL